METLWFRRVALLESGRYTREETGEIKPYIPHQLPEDATVLLLDVSLLPGVSALPGEQGAALQFVRGAGEE